VQGVSRGGKGALCQDERAHFAAAFDDLHESGISKSSSDRVVVCRRGGGQYLKGGVGSGDGTGGTEVFGEHSRGDHVGGPLLPQVTGVLASAGSDLLTDVDLCEVLGHKLVLGERDPELFTFSRMSGGFRHTGTENADASPGHRQTTVSQGCGDKKGQGQSDTADECALRDAHLGEFHVGVPGSAAAEWALRCRS